MVCDHVIRLQSGSPWWIALVAFAASNTYYHSIEQVRKLKSTLHGKFYRPTTKLGL
jgi:hypothetical protein